MSELNDRCLNQFPEWLRALATDATEMSNAVADAASVNHVAAAHIVGGLNYLFKSLDLISDGIGELGFLDDAFVVRVAAALALREAPALGASRPALTRLADDTTLIAELLGKDYARLENYVRTLRSGAARGRSVDDILNDEQARTAFLNEVTGWASSYSVPSFSRDEKNLVKLKSFLLAKLPG